MTTLSVFQPICGIFSAGSFGLDGAHLAFDPAEPRRFNELEPALAQKLHADANAEERPALAANRLFKRFDEARNALQPVLAVGVGADTRQHDAIGAENVLGSRTDDDLRRSRAIPRRALESLGGGVEIPRPVVDDDDALHKSFGLDFFRAKPSIRMARSVNRAASPLRNARTLPASRSVNIGCAGSQLSKNRRSHSAIDLPVTTPSVCQPVCSSIHRFSVEISKPR